jgi:transposase-like protein
MIPEHELRQMYWEQGMTQKDIAEVHGVSEGTISNRMKLHGIRSRTKSEVGLGRQQPANPLKPSKENMLLMYYNEKMSMHKIAKEIGVGSATIFRWLKEYGIESRTISEAVSGIPKPIHPSKPPIKYLKKMYIDDQMSTSEIAKEINVSTTSVLLWMKQYNIKTRTISMSLIGKFAGENNPSWQGGTSFEPYCNKFNNRFKESVRRRDDYTCQLCGHKQNSRKLSVHHIHYNKSDCWPDVVALCNSCHGRVNANRGCWEQYFENQLSERGLACWSISQET